MSLKSKFFHLLLWGGIIGCFAFAPTNVHSGLEGVELQQVASDLPTQITLSDIPIKTQEKPKLNTKLNQILTAYHQYGSADWQNHTDLTELVIQEARILVELRFDEQAASEMHAYLTNYGMELRHNNAPGIFEAWLPISALDAITENPAIYFIRPARLVKFNSVDVGASTSQGVAQSNADVWHANGIDGTGVTIAIIDGFNSATIVSLQASGDWPTGTQLTMVDVDGGGFGDLGEDHGMANLEIAYDMAPGANFIAYETQTVGDWYTALGLAATAGADISSAALTAPLDGVGDGTAMAGSIAEAAANARGSGVFPMNAAGNGRQIHWGGLYAESGSTPFGYAGSHDWGSGGNLNFGIYCYSVGWSLSVDLFWDDWTAPVDHDYDLVLLQYDALSNPSGFSVLAYSGDMQNGGAGQLPQEQAGVTIAEASGAASGCSGSGAAVAVLILKWSAATDRNLQVFANSFVQLNTFVETSSLGFPADSASVLSVAAIDVATHTQESYSSEGPILPTGGGPAPAAPSSPLAGPEKPDVVSFANVDTQSYGAGTFGGASAAVSHTAGFAALVLQNNLAFTVAQLEAEIINIASTGSNDLGAPGHDNEYGWGRMQFGLTPTAVTLSNLAGRSPATGLTLTVFAVLLTTGGLFVRKLKR